MADTSDVMAPRTTVAALIDSLAPSGTETSLVEIAPALRAHGVDMVIVTLRRTEPSLVDRARNEGTEVVELDEDRWWRQVRAVRRWLRDREPDVLSTSLFVADQVGRLAAVRTGVPVVSSLVNTPYVGHGRRGPLLRRAKRRAVQLIDAVTGRALVDHFHAVTAGCKAHAVRTLRTPADRITVVHRGRSIDPTADPGPARARVRAEMGIDDDRPLVVNLGRIEPQKAHVDLIRASEILHHRGVHHTLAIAGKTGSSSGEVAAAAARLCRDGGDVRLLGHRDDAIDLLRAADALVVSSQYEGTAGAAIEAMAVGTPIVTTDVEGLRGLVDDDVTAAVAPVGDAERLAAAIERVLDDDALAGRLTRNGRDLFAREFTTDVASRRLAELLRQAAGA